MGQKERKEKKKKNPRAQITGEFTEDHLLLTLTGMETT